MQRVRYFDGYQCLLKDGEVIDAGRALIMNQATADALAHQVINN